MEAGNDLCNGVYGFMTPRQGENAYYYRELALIYEPVYGKGAKKHRLAPKTERALIHVELQLERAM